MALTVTKVEFLRGWDEGWPFLVAVSFTWELTVYFSFSPPGSIPGIEGSRMVEPPGVSLGLGVDGVIERAILAQWRIEQRVGTMAGTEDHQ